jgi:hypothetical protein
MLNEDGIPVSIIPCEAPVQFTAAKVVRVEAVEQSVPFPPRIMVGFGVDDHNERGNISIQSDEDRSPACWALFFTCPTVNASGSAVASAGGHARCHRRASGRRA